MASLHAAVHTHMQRDPWIPLEPKWLFVNQMKQARPELYSRPARRRFQGFLKAFRQGLPPRTRVISVRPTRIYH